MIPPKDSTWYQPVHYHHCKIRLGEFAKKMIPTLEEVKWMSKRFRYFAEHRTFAFLLKTLPWHNALAWMQKPKKYFQTHASNQIMFFGQKRFRRKSSEKGQKKKRQKKVCENKPYFYLKHNQKKKFFLKTNVGNLIPLQYRGILRQLALQVFHF